MTTPQLPDEIKGSVTDDTLGPTGPGNKRKSRAFAQITIPGVPSEVQNSIRHRAARLEKDQGEWKRYAKRALLIHALLCDFKARTAQDVAELKTASEGFMRVVDKLEPKRPAVKK